MKYESYGTAVYDYKAFTAEEEAEKKLCIDYIEKFSDILSRDNTLIHMTTSAFIVNPERDRILMVYHNIYDSWSWVGGHCDGEEQPLLNAVKEMQEETGVENFKTVSDKPISLNLLTVAAHYRKGEYVAPHIHLDLTYLFEVSEEEMMMIKEDENSAVGWVKFSELEEKCSEEHMIPLYKKLIERVKKEFSA